MVDKLTKINSRPPNPPTIKKLDSFRARWERSWRWHKKVEQEKIKRSNLKISLRLKDRYRTLY